MIIYIYIYAELCLLVCVIIACHVKESIPEEEPNGQTPDGENFSKYEGKSH
jgi:hypothetical protein